MTNELLADELVPIAARLVATVRDYGPEDVAAVLAEVPEGRHDALAIVLAAMVDPDARPSQLLAWTQTGPVQSRDGRENLTTTPIAREHGTIRGYYQHRGRGDMPVCKPCAAARTEANRQRAATRALGAVS